MHFKNTPQFYGAVAKIFHWLLAALIICMLALGLTMAGMKNSPDKFKLIGLHKELGIVALCLVSLRLGWKMLNVSPLLPESLGKLAIVGARTVHFLLYAMMFAMPLTGWLMTSAVGFPVSVFGLFLLPNLVAPDKALANSMNQLHEIFAWALIGLIALHVAAALLHHFYYRDNILLRMLPNFRKRYHVQNSDINTGC
jgi:cytochrome b561